MTAELSTTGSVVEVDPGEIQKELARIWRETAELDKKQDTDSGGETRIRATLANVVIIVSEQDNESVRLADELVTELCHTYPSRFFIVTLTEGNETPLKTFVSSRCGLGSSGAHVCTEEIHVKASKEGFRFIPNLLSSLYVSDVDVQLFIVGDRFFSIDGFSTLLENLTSQCDTIVYDSMRMQNIDHCKLFAAAAEKGQAATERVVLRDMAWYRVERLRELVAAQFDVPAYLEALPKKFRVRLKGSEKGPTSAPGQEMLLVAGWLASRLDVDISNAKFSKVGGSAMLTMNRKRGGDVEIAFSEEGYGQLQSIDFELQEKEEEALTFSLSHTGDGNIELKAAGFAVPAQRSGFDYSVRRLSSRTERGLDRATRALRANAPDFVFEQSAAYSREIAALVQKASSAG